MGDAAGATTVDAALPLLPASLSPSKQIPKTRQSEVLHLLTADGLHRPKIVFIQAKRCDPERAWLRALEILRVGDGIL